MSSFDHRPVLALLLLGNAATVVVNEWLERRLVVAHNDPWSGLTTPPVSMTCNQTSLQRSIADFGFGFWSVSLSVVLLFASSFLSNMRELALLGAPRSSGDMPLEVSSRSASLTAPLLIQQEFFGGRSISNNASGFLGSLTSTSDFFPRQRSDTLFGRWCGESIVGLLVTRIVEVLFCLVDLPDPRATSVTTRLYKLASGGFLLSGACLCGQGTIHLQRDFGPWIAQQFFGDNAKSPIPLTLQSQIHLVFATLFFVGSAIHATAVTSLHFLAYRKGKVDSELIRPHLLTTRVLILLFMAGSLWGRFAYIFFREEQPGVIGETAIEFINIVGLFQLVQISTILCFLATALFEPPNCYEPSTRWGR